MTPWLTLFGLLLSSSAWASPKVQCTLDNVDNDRRAQALCYASYGDSTKCGALSDLQHTYCMALAKGTSPCNAIDMDRHTNQWAVCMAMGRKQLSSCTRYERAVPDAAHLCEAILSHTERGDLSKATRVCKEIDDLKLRDACRDAVLARATVVSETPPPPTRSRSTTVVTTDKTPTRSRSQTVISRDDDEPPPLERRTAVAPKGLEETTETPTEKIASPPPDPRAYANRYDGDRIRPRVQLSVVRSTRPSEETERTAWVDSALPAVTEMLDYADLWVNHRDTAVQIARDGRYHANVEFLLDIEAGEQSPEEMIEIWLGSSMSGKLKLSSATRRELRLHLQSNPQRPDYRQAYKEIYRYLEATLKTDKRKPRVQDWLRTYLME